MSDPYPKSRQLARGERRYRRKIASPKQWAAIRAEKLTACRLCEHHLPANNWPFGCPTLVLHHLIARSQGGHDIADNLVCLCQPHHDDVEARRPVALQVLAAHLTDEEYAYCVGKLGEGAMGRLFGV